MESLRDFFNMVDSTEPLSEADVLDLCKRAQEGDTSARDQLWRTHLRLIAYIAKRFYRFQSFLEWGDLMQQGSLGLLRAIDRFDVSRRYKGRPLSFSWYATYWIAHTIRRELQKRGRTVALPVYLQQELSRWKQELKGMRSCSRKRSLIEMKRLSQAEQSVYSLDEGPSEEAETPRGSRTAWRGGFDLCDQELLQKELGQAIREMVSALPPREGYVVQKHFGLGTVNIEWGDRVSEEIPCQALALEMGVSAERIRQLKQRALCRLRKAILHRPELHPDGV